MTFYVNIYVDGDDDAELLKLLHQSIQKVTNDIENLRFNTAISQLMILTNLCIKKQKASKNAVSVFARLLSPFAPHLAEEIWQLLGNDNTITYEPWPVFDEKYLQEDSFEYPVSVNGKLRFKLEMPVDASKENVEKAALEHEIAKKWIEGKQVRKVIVVPNKIVNIVVG